jgi:hypothetical protein
MKTKIFAMVIISLIILSACSGFAGKAAMRGGWPQPRDGTIYSTGETVKLIAHARGVDGPGISKVTFTVGNRGLETAGTDSNARIVVAAANWKISEGPGYYTVTATAMDTGGKTKVVSVKVQVVGPRTVGGPLPDKCAQLQQREIGLVDLGWLDDGGYLVYFKMKDGVPGLKVSLPGLQGPWEYQASAGESASGDCHVETFDDRLFCVFSGMVGGQGQRVGFHLSVDGCDLYSGYLNIPFIILTTEPPPPEIKGCGPEPNPITAKEKFIKWCECKGGSLDSDDHGVKVCIFD